MKVLFLTSRGLNLGGVGEVIAQLSKSLIQQNVNVDLYTGYDSTTKDSSRLISQGSEVHYGPLLKPGWRAHLFRHFTMRPLINIVKKHKIDVVHAHGTYRSGLIAMHLKKMMGTPYVITSHGDVIARSSDRINRDDVQSRCRAILKNADAVTHLSHYMASMSHAILDTTDKSFIIPNAVDFTEWEMDETAKEHDYLFCIGRQVKDKGFDVAIQAFALLVKQGLSTSLVIAGEGKDKQAFKELAKNLGLRVLDFSSDKSPAELPPQSVCFIGAVGGEIKKKWFQHARCILFTTQPHLWEEAFGLVPLETMAAKKHIIVSDLPIMREMQNTGFNIDIVLSPTDPKAWAKQICDSFNHKELTTERVQHNFNRVKQYDWPLIAKQYKQVYEKTINR